MEKQLSHLSFWHFAISIALGMLTFWLGYQIERSDFYTLIVLYGIFFFIYIGIFNFYVSRRSVYFFLIIGVLLRFLLIFSLPNLSDDIYRFIWDGRLLVAGLNPFDYLPSHYIENDIQVKGLDTDLFNKLNSPNYFTIYPPVNQAIFALAAWLSPSSIWGSSIVMKSFLFLCEVGSIFLIIRLLKHFHLPASNALLYALNPLIILEVMGNIHFEGAMVFFMLLVIWLLFIKRNWLASGVAFAFSVASKLLPLMFLPLLLRRIAGAVTPLYRVETWRSLDWRKVASYLVLIGGVLFVLFFPLFNLDFIRNFGDSLNLYFQKFEFNASLYYLFRWIGFQMRGYNIIHSLGPFLAIISFVSILLITLLEQKTDGLSLFKRLLFTISIYLFCTTTVHPWYLALPIVFCVFTNYRFPILWSGLSFMTYINYSYPSYTENLWVVGIEYFLVGSFLLFETKNNLL